ncbi:MAG: hypothetical protein HZC28_03765 [Spirochaetes bacterium]|nr:hypothetical protein [Spirochaetota bacterium]
MQKYIILIWCCLTLTAEPVSIGLSVGGEIFFPVGDYTTPSVGGELRVNTFLFEQLEIGGRLGFQVYDTDLRVIDMSSVYAFPLTVSAAWRFLGSNIIAAAGLETGVIQSYAVWHDINYSALDPLLRPYLEIGYRLDRFELLAIPYYAWIFENFKPGGAVVSRPGIKIAFQVRL